MQLCAKWPCWTFLHVLVCLLRFTLVQKHTVEFNQVAMANSEGSEAMLNRVMTKDNIGVAVVLEVHKELFATGMYDNCCPTDWKGQGPVRGGNDFYFIKLCRVCLHMTLLLKYLEWDTIELATLIIVPTKQETSYLREKTQVGFWKLVFSVSCLTWMSVRIGILLSGSSYYLFLSSISPLLIEHISSGRHVHVKKKTPKNPSCQY